METAISTHGKHSNDPRIGKFGVMFLEREKTEVQSE